MGLIKAIGGAIRGTMADQWKEYFYCDAMEADVLVTKGQMRKSGNLVHPIKETIILSRMDR